MPSHLICCGAISWTCSLLTGLGFLERKGLLEKAVDPNRADTAFFLDKKKPIYLGGTL